MGVLIRLFGDKPRVRTLEGLLRFGEMQFTVPELADEVGLHKPSAYRKIDQLSSEGFIKQVQEARPAQYRVNWDNPRMKLLGTFNSALQRIDRYDMHREEVDAVLNTFREGALRQTNLLDRQLAGIRNQMLESSLSEDASTGPPGPEVHPRRVKLKA